MQLLIRLRGSEINPLTFAACKGVTSLSGLAQGICRRSMPSSMYAYSASY